MIPEYELRQMYHGDGMLQREIADIYGVSQQTISGWLKLYDIKSRTISESMLHNSTKPSKKEIEIMYYDEEMSQLEIADKINVNQATISLWMKSYEIKSRTRSELKLGNSMKPSKESLEEMYLDKNMTSGEISDKLGFSHWSILNWMKEYGIEIRKRSEYMLMENNINWKNGASFKPYCYKFNDSFRELVRRRDKYTCQLCGLEQEHNGRKLDVHHIHYDKENCYPDVISLCRSCHVKMNSNRDYWEEHFENHLIKNGLFCWSISQEIDNT